MPDFAVTTAFRATDRLSPVFNRMGNSARRFETQSIGVFGRISNAARRTRSAIMSALPYVGIATLGIYANKAINLASDLTEVQNVVDTTFRNSSKIIDRWADQALDKFGLSELQAKNFTGTLGSMAKSSGITGDALVKMTTELVGLAGDYASFRNLRPEEAFQKMKSVVTGETEPLRQLGLNMTVANLQAFALSQGINKTWKSMTQAEQVMLRYNYVLQNSKDVQGDFAKTLEESYANQKRVLGVQFDQFLANIAKNILPSLVDLFKSMNLALRNMPVKSIASGLESIVKILPYIIGGYVAWKVATYAVIAAQAIMTAAGWIKYLWMMREFITKAAVAQWALNIAMSANPVFLITAGIAALIIYIGIAIKYWDKFGAAMTIVLGPIGMLISYMKTLYDRWAAIKAAFTTEGMIAGLKALGWALIEAMIMPFKQLWGILKSITGFGGGGEAPNKAEIESRNQQTTVNLYNQNVETKAEVIPRLGAQINYEGMGAQ